MLRRTAEGPVRRWVPFVTVVLAGLLVGAACSTPPPVASGSDALSGDTPNTGNKTAGRQKKSPSTPAAKDALRDGGANASNASNTVGSDGCGTTTAFAVCSMAPASVTAGSVGTSGLILTVTGGGFDGASVVMFGGSDVPTKLVNASTLTATVPPQLLADVGSRTVAVRGMAGTTAPKMFAVTASSNASNPTNEANGTDEAEVIDVVDVDDSCGVGIFTCDDVGLSPDQCGVLDGETVQCLIDDFGNACIFEDCD